MKIKNIIQDSVFLNMTTWPWNTKLYIFYITSTTHCIMTLLFYYLDNSFLISLNSLQEYFVINFLLHSNLATNS